MMSGVDSVTTKLIDVWNSNTFGDQLRSELGNSDAIIKKYHSEGARLKNLDRVKNLDECLQGNKYFCEFEALQHKVAANLEGQQIRVWHYTRLFEHEVTSMKCMVQLSTEERMRARLNEVLSRGHLTKCEFEVLLKGSALKTQSKIRENRFFCVPNPIRVTDGSVERLLGYWGGEVVYFHQKNESLKRKLGLLGFPRVIEISAEISDPLTRYSLAGCVLNTCAFDLGFSTYPANIDVCIKQDPPPVRVLTVHTLDGIHFQEIGLSYPEGADKLLSRHNKWNSEISD